MSLEWKIDMSAFVYLKFPYGINVECELGGTETEQKNQLGKQNFLILKKILATENNAVHWGNGNGKLGSFIVGKLGS